LKKKPRGLHFDTIEMMEAESQSVLNTLTGHYFQGAFKKWQKSWEQCIRDEGDYCGLMVASRPKVDF
jgi:hypothetical protein